jgi:hypothetical protein
MSSVPNNLPVSDSILYKLQDEITNKGYYIVDCPFCLTKHKNQMCEAGAKLLFSYVEKDRIAMKSVILSASLGSTPL